MSTGALVVRATSARKAHFLRLLSTRCMQKFGVPVFKIAITSPGKPAPVPRSSKSRELRRVGKMARPESRERRRRDEIGALLPMREQIGEALQPVDCFTWNVKGFGEIGRPTDGKGRVPRGHPVLLRIRRA